MNSGLEGVVAADTVLSHTDGDTGTIWVRGHTIGDLVANHGFEGTVAIIWEGFAGAGLTRTSIQSEFGAGREQRVCGEERLAWRRSETAAARRRAHRARGIAGGCNACRHRRNAAGFHRRAHSHPRGQGADKA